MSNREAFQKKLVMITSSDHLEVRKLPPSKKYIEILRFFYLEDYTDWISVLPMEVIFELSDDKKEIHYPDDITSGNPIIDGEDMSKLPNSINILDKDTIYLRGEGDEPNICIFIDDINSITINM